MPNADDFQNALNEIFAAAQRNKNSSVRVVSADLHRHVGGYPGRDHRMPLCCNVMKKNIQPGDEIMDEPPSGQGATLSIRYKLPR